MDGNQTLYCTVLDKKDQSKFLCYARRKTSIFNLGLTNATQVWSTDFTEETLRLFKQKCALKSTEDYILKIRTACGRGNVSVSVEDASAELHVGSRPGDLSVVLSRLGETDAKEELREMLFQMADRLAQLDSTGSPSVSPVKSQQKRNAEFEPREHQLSGPSVTVKKRLPGDSLINPGSRSDEEDNVRTSNSRKRPASGVTFDDDDK